LKRIFTDKLLLWKDKPKRKPLVLQGARQVGKTYLVNDFGEKHFKNYIKFNFEEDPSLHEYFNQNLSPDSLLMKLSLHIGKKISAKDTLLFFDEIQACPKAITSLKYFCEEYPELPIIAAGSLLGISYGKPSSFPVGKVEFLTIQPLNFYEYLLAIEEELLASYLFNEDNWKIISSPIAEKLTMHYKMHVYLGGMPEVLQNYITNKNPEQAREIQLQIITAYQNDFSKYSTPLQANKIMEVWKSIPYQLAKETKKFKFSDVKNKARASSYEGAIQWLKSAGLVTIVNQLRDIKLPLGGYADFEKFKIYILDTGLLCAMLQIPSSIVLKPNALFKEYNGGLIENYVCTELTKNFDTELFYWTNQSGNAEVDFILQHNSTIVPIEVKSGTNSNILGLRNFEEKYKPQQIFRFSPKPLHIANSFTNVPLYLLMAFKKMIHQN
jgi:uncharacterized protein